ncbi:MAG TPA: hypothetical protein VGX25_00935 [Actinophytocola sp.]|uniref:glycan biosynthesis hexose transferase WsfD n=1 Tax=Actinophytocola sp. TaxID=1872138 RepID=UPI002DDD91CD|nr:hypothetical protein [Actinophytocola sp.]HEV2777941.1 hypothetical protein [Actinophytocola sp.]
MFRSARSTVPLAVGAFAVSLGALLLRFLVPRPVGLTDNGDGWRLLCQVGASDGDRVGDEFVELMYRGSNSCVSVYAASQVWLARLAQWIGALLDDPAALNLIILGVVGCVLAAIAVAAVTVGLPLALGWRLPLGALVLLLVADSAFFGYLASVVTEGPAFVGIVLAVGGLLRMQRPGGGRYAGAVCAAAGAILAVNAKPQTLMIFPLFVLALLVARKPGRTRPARWAAPVAVAVAVAGVSAAVQQAGAPKDALYGTEEMNAYHAIFNSIVDGHHDTAGDLADLGLPQEFAAFIGTRIWDASEQHPLYERYRNRFTRANLMRYYVTHPERTAQILDRSATDLLTVRADYQGSFARDAGFPPRTKEFRVPVFSGLFRLVAPLGLVVLLPLWLLLGWAGVRALRRGRRDLGTVLLFVLSVALGQYLAAALGEGIENVKHQVIAAFCTGFAMLLAVATLLPRPRPVEPSPAEPEAETEPVAEPVLQPATR